MPMFQDHQMCRCAQHNRNGFHSKAAPIHYPPDLGLEPKHLDIDLTVLPREETARGTVTVTVEALRSGVSNIELDAVDIDIQAVSDSEGGGLTHSYDGKKLSVTWDDEFAVGEVRRVAITYQVVSPVAGLYFSYPTDEFPNRPTWAATDHETERARHWLPCIDHPNVRTTLSFQLRADQRYTILANGAEQETIADGTYKIAQWDLDFPCPSYILCFALGEFTEKKDGEFNDLPVAYYASKAWTPEHLERSFGRTKKMLEWMTDRLDRPFPFPKYFQFSLPGIGGAMENISLVSWDEIFMLDEQLATEWTWLVDQVNVHEMAHSYFGDAVVCRDFSHVWLKESWATYMEQCWLEDTYGDDEKQYDFFRNSHAYFSEADGSYKRPMVTRKFDSSWDMYDRHLYPGGAARLHTLRSELGDEAFWSGVTAYLEENTGKVVETEDFRRAMERHSGRALAKFFDQWFYTAGYPDLELSFSHDAKKGLGTFTVTQKQIDAESGEGPEFDVELELSWTIGAERTTEKVRLDQRVRHYTFTMADEPRLVSADPHGKLLHKQTFNPGDPKLREQLNEGTTLERIRAALTLGKTAKAQNIDAIVAAYAGQEFWGVRQQFASALAEAGTARALEALAGLIAEERDAMVLQHLYEQAGQFRDEKIEAALKARSETGELPPWAARAAYRGLGRQSHAHFDKLAAAAKTGGIHDIARSGALEGLAESRSKDAIEPLVAAGKDGEMFYRARMLAVSALGTLATFLEKPEKTRVREALEDMLRDPTQPVAVAAAGALARMGARESVPKIEQLAARVAHQDSVGLRRVVEKIHGGKQDAVTALEQQLKDLRADYRKLADRLEKLEGKDV